MSEFIDIVFDGPAAHESGRFIEVEDDSGASVDIGEWIHREDGMWALRLKAQDTGLRVMQNGEWVRLVAMPMSKKEDEGTNGL